MKNKKNIIEKLSVAFKDSDSIGHRDLLVHFYPEEIKWLEKEKHIESNHAEYDNAEPTFKIIK